MSHNSKLFTLGTHATLKQCSIQLYTQKVERVIIGHKKKKKEQAYMDYKIVSFKNMG